MTQQTLFCHKKYSSLRSMNNNSRPIEYTMNTNNVMKIGQAVSVGVTNTITRILYIRKKYKVLEFALVISILSWM